MKTKPKNSVFFLLAFAAGFILGGGFVLWHQYFMQRMIPTQKLKSFIESQFEKKAGAAKKTSYTGHESQGDKTLAITDRSAPQTATTLPYDTTAMQPSDTVALADTLHDTILSDTIYFTDLDYGIYDFSAADESESDIVVMRDKKVAAKTMVADACELTTQKKDKTLDSLLIGGQQTQENLSEFLVEFWQSPLNYRGYKRHKNKVVLYGIPQYDFASLKLLDNKLYLKYLNDYYLLEDTPSFKNLINVTDKALIKNLKDL